MISITCIFGGLFIGATIFWMLFTMPLWYGYYGIATGIIFTILLIRLKIKINKEIGNGKSNRHKCC